MSSARAATWARVQGGPEQQDRVTDPLGPSQGVGRPGQRLFEQWRHEEREEDVVEDAHDGGVVAGGFGERESLVGQRLATFERAPVGEFRTQGGEHGRPVGVVWGEPIEGQLEDLHFVGVDGAGRREHASVVGQGGGHKALGVAELASPSSGVEEGVAKGWISRLALGRAEPDGQVDAQDRIRVVGSAWRSSACE